VEKLLADHVATKPVLEDWHERAHTCFVGVLADKRPLDLMKGVLTRSYSVWTRQEEQINPERLLRLLHTLHAELSNFLSSPEMVYPYAREGITPYFTFDQNMSQGASNEILESVALPNFVRFPEFWRASPDGLISDVRSHPEDYLNLKIDGEINKRWFSPLFMTRRLYSLIQHAYLFSEKFQSPQFVEFRCEWTGLLDREMRDHEPMVDWGGGKIARVDGRVTWGTWPVNDVRMQWPEIASSLGGPILRLFDPTFSYSPEWIRSQMRRILGWDERAGPNPS
jgi:hypothetical protein